MGPPGRMQFDPSAQEVAKKVVTFSRQHPLIIAMARGWLGDGLGLWTRTVRKWRSFTSYFENYMNMQPPGNEYPRSLGEAVDISLGTLTADARNLMLSFGARPSSNIRLVRVVR